MKVIAPGTYPEQNEKVCPKCGCRFRYYDNEVKHESTNPDEEEFFGGFGSYDYINCPECNYQIHWNVKFIAYDSWVDKLCDWFRYLKHKFRRKKK